MALMAISRGIDAINTWIGRASIWLILVMVVVSASNAVVRKVFDVSSNAWLELQWNLFGAVFMLAASYTLLKGEHIRIDVVYSRFSRPTQLKIDLLGHCLFLMPFVLIMIYDSVPFALLAFEQNEQSLNSGGLLTWPAKALLPVGFFLLFLQGVSEIIKTGSIMAGHIPDPVLERDKEELRLTQEASHA